MKADLAFTVKSEECLILHTHTHSFFTKNVKSELISHLVCSFSDTQKKWHYLARHC